MQEKKQTNIDLIVTQYLSGTLDNESFNKLKSYCFESEANREYVRKKLEIWFSSGAVSSTVHFDKEKAFYLFQQRVTCNSKRQKKLFSWKLFMRIAVVMVILIIPLATYWQGKEAVKQTFEDMIVEVPIGAHTKLFLSDGTLVWLNAGSKIIYSQGFGVDNRQLQLEGEGYFEVARNEKIPFEIKTKEVNLTVLGTKFNFRNYQEDKEVIVNLLEGKVVLQNGVKKMPKLYLTPNEKMVLNKVTGQMVKSHTKADKSTVWINDELLFDEELLEDIAKKLMRNYKVKIVVADSLRNKRFYGNFKVSTNNIEEILEAMVLTKQMRYKFENDVYILY